MEGIVLINKPKNLTSRDVINKLNHIFQMKRIGHTGTLDPLATGVLVCVLGKYTKLVNELTSLNKEYIAEITLGVKTDTGDISGNVLEKQNIKLSIKDIEEVFQKFPKKYFQTVPIYSAVKIKGKKLYEYARNKEEVELPQREVNIYSLQIISFKNNIIKFKCLVSKGTYIRSLITDICSKLNVIGTMSSLTRTKQGNFSIDDTFTLEDIENNNYKLLKVEEVFCYPIIDLNDSLFTKVSNGSKIANTFNIEDKVMFRYNKTIIAIYKKEEDILKPYIML